MLLLNTVALSFHTARAVFLPAGRKAPYDKAASSEVWCLLQAELGDIVYVEMPEVGSQMESGAVFGVVESVKVCSKRICVLMQMSAVHCLKPGSSHRSSGCMHMDFLSGPQSSADKT